MSHGTSARPFAACEPLHGAALCSIHLGDKEERK
jgi:hypothetical protein